MFVSLLPDRFLAPTEEENSESCPFFWEIGRKALQKTQFCPQPSSLPSLTDEGERLMQSVDRLECDLKEYHELAISLLESETPDSSGIIPFPQQDSVLEQKSCVQSKDGQQEPALSGRRNLAFWHSMLEQTHLSIYARAVYTHLVMRGKNAFPSITTIAKSCSISRSAVIKAILELEQIGLIEVMRADGRVSHYLVRSLEQWQAQQPVQISTTQPVQISTGPDIDQSTTATGPVHVVDSKEINLKR